MSKNPQAPDFRLSCWVLDPAPMDDISEKYRNCFNYFKLNSMPETFKNDSMHFKF